MPTRWPLTLTGDFLYSGKRVHYNLKTVKVFNDKLKLNFLFSLDHSGFGFGRATENDDIFCYGFRPLFKLRLPFVTFSFLIYDINHALLVGWFKFSPALGQYFSRWLIGTLQ